MAVTCYSDLLSEKGFTPPSATYPKGLGGFETVWWNLDFAAILALGVTLDPSAGDVLIITKIPVGAMILTTQWKVITGLEDTLTTGTILGQVGDYSAVTGTGTAIDLDGYGPVTTGITLKTADAVLGTAIGDAYGAAHKVYSTAAYLALTFSGTAVDIISGRMILGAKMSLTDFPDLSVTAPSTWH